LKSRYFEYWLIRTYRIITSRRWSSGSHGECMLPVSLIQKRGEKSTKFSYKLLCFSPNLCNYYPVFRIPTTVLVIVLLLDALYDNIPILLISSWLQPRLVESRSEYAYIITRQQFVSLGVYFLCCNSNCEIDT